MSCRPEPSILGVVLLIVTPSLALCGHPDNRPNLRTDRFGDPLPPGVVARCGTVRLRPIAEPLCCAFSPDGKLLATGETGRLGLWDLRIGKEVHSFALPGVVAVGEVRFSADGKQVAVVGARTLWRYGVAEPSDAIFVGDVASGRVLRRIDGAACGFESVAFLNGNTALAARMRSRFSSAGEEERVVLWDIATGKELQTISKVLSLACSPDGRAFATSHEDGTVRLRDAATRRERHRLRAHRNGAWSVAFSPDGRTLATGGGEPAYRDPFHLPWAAIADNSICLWDVATGRQHHRLIGHLVPVPSLLFSLDGGSLLSHDLRGGLIVWNVSDGGVRWCLTDESWDNIPAFSPDGNRLAWIKNLPPPLNIGIGVVREVNLTTGKERPTWEYEMAERGSLTYSRDGKVLAVGGRHLHLWDVKSGQDRRLPQGHCAAVESVEYSPDGRFLTTRDQSKDFRVWEAATGKPVYPPAPDRPYRPYLHGFSREGTSLTIVDEDLTVRVWRMPEVRLLRTFKVGTPRTLRLWADVLTQPKLYEPWHSFVAGRCLALGAGNERLAVAREDEHLHLWDVKTGKALCRLPHRAAFETSLVFAPDGRALLTRGSDQTLRLWRLPDGVPLAHLRGEKEEHPFFDFSRDGRWLAWGWGRTIRMWDLVRGREMRRLHGHEGKVREVAFEADGRTLVSAGDDGTVRAWDVASGRERRRLTSEVPDHPDASVVPASRGLALLRAADSDGGRSLREALTGRELVVLKWTEDVAVSPDGRVLAINASVPRLLETATGSEILRLPAGHRGNVTTMAFSPNGQMLATGGADSTVLVWDWQRLRGLTGSDGAKKDPEALWADLAAKDAPVAYRAIGSLASDPGRTVAFLARQVRPLRTEDCEPVRRLLKDLEDKRFAPRRQAQRELAKLGAEWAPLLEEVLAGEPSLEVRRRIEPLLDAPAMRRWSPEMVRQLRALYALELIGTAEARRLLERVADGLPEARLTQEAKAALQRLRRK
jgi:WD40 repeat protein